MNTGVNTRPMMRRYDIGISVIVIVGVALIGGVLIGDAPSRHDRVTMQHFDNVNYDLNTYATSKRRLPETLKDLYLKNPPGDIEYKKLSSTVFMLCATFNEPSKSSYVEQSSRSEPNKYQRLQQIDDSTTTYTSVDQYAVSAYNHKAGRNCYISENDSASGDIDKFHSPNDMDQM